MLLIGREHLDLQGEKQGAIDEIATDVRGLGQGAQRLDAVALQRLADIHAAEGGVEVGEEVADVLGLLPDLRVACPEDVLDLADGGHPHVVPVDELVAQAFGRLAALLFGDSEFEDLAGERLDDILVGLVLAPAVAFLQGCADPEQVGGEVVRCAGGLGHADSRKGARTLLSRPQASTCGG